MLLARKRPKTIIAEKWKKFKRKKYRTVRMVKEASLECASVKKASYVTTLGPFFVFQLFYTRKNHLYYIVYIYLYAIIIILF